MSTSAANYYGLYEHARGVLTEFRCLISEGIKPDLAFAFCLVSLNHYDQALPSRAPRPVDDRSLSRLLQALQLACAFYTSPQVIKELGVEQAEAMRVELLDLVTQLTEPFPGYAALSTWCDN